MRARMHGMVSTGALAAVVLALSLAGCALPGPSGGADGARDRAREAARERVAELARDIGDERPDGIDGFAREAVAASAPETGGPAAGIELVGIDAQQADRLDEPFGTLSFRVTDAQAAAPGATPDADAAAPDAKPGDDATPGDDGDPLVFCFEVVFDYYGKVGEWSTTEGVGDIPCPAGPPVVPPPDTTVREVVAANARDAVHAVLEQRIVTGAPPDAAGIADAIGALLAEPDGELEVAAPARVLVEPGPNGGSLVGGDRVGVALGHAEECVLVKLDGGVVEDVRPAPVLLLPGELGCTPETALADAERLRSPH